MDVSQTVKTDVKTQNGMIRPGTFRVIAGPCTVESYDQFVAAAKAALSTYSKGLSKEVGPKGIRVNAVAPGPIWTPLNPFGGSTPEKMATFGQNVPLGRPGQPNEVAPSFLFLACEDASYMTGQVLHPNGGYIVNV